MRLEEHTLENMRVTLKNTFSIMNELFKQNKIASQNYSVVTKPEAQMLIASCRKRLNLV